MHPDPSSMHFYIKTSLTLLIAISVLAPCGWFTIGPPIARQGKIPIENFIAYNLTVLIVLGFAVTIIAADRWSVACIWGGAAMFAGAAIGVLFGIPSASVENSRRQGGVDAARAASLSATSAADGSIPVTDELSAPATGDPSTPAVAVQPVPPAIDQAKGQTLLGDTAGWMSKFLAGAGFAQAVPIMRKFISLSYAVGDYVMIKNPSAVSQADPTALGGGILLYFGILGFFCGLILPIYYVKQLPDH